MNIKKIHLVFAMLAMLLVALSTVSVSANPVECPGTATPGYLKRHPEVWSEGEIWTHLKGYFGVDDPGQVMEWLRHPTQGDKTYTLFRAAFAAKFNFLNGCYCEEAPLGAAIWWLEEWPVGSGVEASSEAWQMAEPWYWELDKYNNGWLCFPARD